jgi:hypothetical protein
MLGMSITDIVALFPFALFWTEYLRHEMQQITQVWAPQQHARSAQGFFYKSVISTVAYNSALVVYFLLVVCYK